MKKVILPDIITYFFILLFVYTGVAKLSEIHLFKEQMVSSPLMGEFAGVIAWGLPIGELLLAVALFIPRFHLKALYLTLILMSAFTIYVLAIFLWDSHLSCSCGGIIEELSPKEHVLFNSACVILSIVAIVVERRRESSARFRWTTGTSALCLFLLVGWTLFTAFSKPATLRTGMEGRLLPGFNLLLEDSTTHLNTADIPGGQSFIVIGFSPWCVHCQAETRDIVKNIQLLKNTRIYYVTDFPFGDMKAFYQYFKLSKYPNIVVGRDTANFYLKYFKATGVPYTAVFDSRKRLKKVLNGQTDAATLAKAVAE
jgi:hypothetical protein